MKFETLPANSEQGPEEIKDELDVQEEKLKKEISQKGYEKLAKIARKFAFVSAMMLPAFAVGCGAVEKPMDQERPAAESKDGFTDNSHDVVKQRMKFERDRIRASSKIKETRERMTPEEKAAAKEAVEDMKKPMIDQDL